MMPCSCVSPCVFPWQSHGFCNSICCENESRRCRQSGFPGETLVCSPVKAAVRGCVEAVIRSSVGCWVVWCVFECSVYDLIHSFIGFVFKPVEHAHDAWFGFSAVACYGNSEIDNRSYKSYQDYELDRFFHGDVLSFWWLFSVRLCLPKHECQGCRYCQQRPASDHSQTPPASEKADIPADPASRGDTKILSSKVISARPQSSATSESVLSSQTWQ